MSLYREAGSRRRPALLALAIGVAAGFLGGFLAARATDDASPSLGDAVVQLRERAREAADALELLTIEYPQAVRDGRVIAPTEYAAAGRDVERARTRIEQLRPDLEALASSDTRRLTEQLDRLATLVRTRAPAAAVERTTAEARATLARVTQPAP